MEPPTLDSLKKTSKWNPRSWQLYRKTHGLAGELKNKERQQNRESKIRPAWRPLSKKPSDHTPKSWQLSEHQGVLKKDHVRSKKWVTQETVGLSWFFEKYREKFAWKDDC